jgi:arginine deiminase
MNEINTVKKKAVIVRTVVSLAICITSLMYAGFKYIEDTKQCKIDVERLRDDILEMKKINANKHQIMDERISQNEKNFEMTTAKLDVSLVRISTDLQFIKEQLMSKGMNK